MRSLVSAVVLVFALTACGGGKEGEPESEAAPKTVKDVCASVETVIPEADINEADWASFLTQVDDLADAADEEARNALDELRPGVEAMIDAPDDDAAAMFELGDSLSAFKDRCVAAGSSAFAS